MKLNTFEQKAIDLLNGGATVPFVARYRKEITGGMDEVALFSLKDRYTIFINLEKRKASILKSLEAKKLSSPGLKARIRDADTVEHLEVIYAPYKTGIKTRAQKARDKGFEIESEKIKAHPVLFSLLPSEVRDGVVDILAEEIAHKQEIRRKLVDRCLNRGLVHSKVTKEGKKKSEESSKFSDYFNGEQEIRTLPGHRILALFRGKKLGLLRLKLGIAEDVYHPLLLQALPLGWNYEISSKELWLQTLDEGWKRLLFPSLEKEVFRILKERADSQAIEVFAKNLRAMFTPSGRDLGPIIAIDPGYRTGCKFVVLDSQGALLDLGVIYPLEPKRDVIGSQKLLDKAILAYNVGGFALGNGTGGRETEEFLKSWTQLPVFMVDERGASVYSASEGAREEFPDLDLTFRSTVSIGRRLQDPSNELVKVEPRALGVGQYQHDIEQKFLARRLSEEVSILVNDSGVNVNRGGKELLSYVSGLSTKNVENIVQYRRKTDGFRSRLDLLKIPGISPEIFQQCAGFLRIEGGDYLLDSTAIHPELYPAVEELARRQGRGVRDLVGQENFEQLDQQIVEKWKKEVLFSEGNYGEPTWELVAKELRNRGKKRLEEIVEFDPAVRSIDNLEPGVVLNGKVTNLTTFGAFVDLGIHLDGLLHISQLSKAFIRDPGEVVSLGQVVRVKILSIDLARKRVSLSLFEDETVSIPSKEK